MTPPTYLFFDLETTGLNYAFDQALQFAAIRTDESFHELERHDILIRLRPDVVPAPEAMISHCIPIEVCQAGMCEYEAVRIIHEQMNLPGTVSLGYNTLGFDDELLRFSFHRNLLAPYTHQYANRCGRMDLLPMLLIYWLYKPQVLNWPEIDGKATFRLEHLKEANQLTEGSSHDAIIDVEATVELARILSREREIWDFLLNYFQKDSDRQRMDKLPPLSETLSPQYTWGLLVGVEFGVQNNFQTPVVYLGDSHAYRNQSLWLRLDRPDLPETTDENISEIPWVVRKKIGQPGILLPPLERYLERIDSERMQVVQENKRWLEKHPELLERIARYHRTYVYPEIPNVDADAVLYQMDFYSTHDERLAERFHRASPAEKAALSDQFRSPVARELARRIIFRNFPEQASGALATDLQQHMQETNPADAADAAVDYRGEPKRTPKAVLAEIAVLLENQAQTLTALQKKRLRELATYLRQNFNLEQGA